MRAVGSVELSPVEAVRSAEERAIRVIWERFGDVWRRRAGMLVPAERIEDNVTSWLRRDFTKLPIVRPEPVEVRETTAGPAFRQGYRLDLGGESARRLQHRGDAVVTGLNRRFRRSYIAIGAVWFLLLLGSLRLDRVTRGYMTGRIRFVSLLLAILATVLIYP